MPEGPELHLASRFVNEACRGLVFGGCVEKSPISRNPEVPFESSAYHISASARGKELRLTLSPLPGAQPSREPLALVFRFGMSGSFQLAPGDALPAHAHLRFYTAPPRPRLALCFVDIRRFGRWDVGGEWQPGRGPCVLLEYEQFRENVLRNLADKAFDRPICEALLDQRFFNGIGNYLRAEILYRLRIPPFEKARTVLVALQQHKLSPELTLSQKIRAKLQNPDLLELCHSVPKEVVQLGGKGYGQESGEEDFAAFRAWLQCYGMAGMSSLRDRHGRTIWFQYCAGGKSRKKKSKGAPRSPEDRMEDPPPPSKTPSSRRSAQRGHPEQTTAQQPEGTSLQQDPEAPPVAEKGKRRGRRATSGGPSSAPSFGDGEAPSTGVLQGIRCGQRREGGCQGLGAELPPHLSSPQPATNPKASRLTPCLWSPRAPWRLSRRLSQLAPSFPLPGLGSPPVPP
ncbi:endonuclease 8-like 1 isoform X2 [Rhinolophus ferrumequinum]|uniref:endonuclease 8-like 1 isoform X2 n=1 Tax=Rhinolophus ferrumequinum TaxID=59479 RepID=UPI00140F6B3D|nr:endonuclease 8-like 1 isoform X2 [Rhinolophus ferrumequinum]